MLPDIIICPKCGSWNIDQTRSHSHKRNFMHLMSGKKIYMCEDCGWRGYIIKAKNLPITVAIFIGIVIMFLIFLSLLK